MKGKKKDFTFYRLRNKYCFFLELQINRTKKFQFQHKYDNRRIFFFVFIICYWWQSLDFKRLKIFLVSIPIIKVRNDCTVAAAAAAAQDKAQQTH